MIPIQYGLYHFSNLKEINPRKMRENMLSIQTIRRANKDHFWSIESEKVKTIRRNSRKLVTVYNWLGLNDTLPVYDICPLKNTKGTGITLCILIRLLDKGRYQNTLQYKSVKKIMSIFSNLWHASNSTLSTSMLVRDIRKTYVTSYHAYSLWFE